MKHNVHTSAQLDRVKVVDVALSSYSTSLNPTLKYSITVESHMNKLQATVPVHSLREHVVSVRQYIQ